MDNEPELPGPPDRFYLQAAQGWLELGNHLEAEAELEKIDPSLLARPAVLEVKWDICLKAKRYDECLDIANVLVAARPTAPSSHVKFAQSFYYQGRYLEAYNSARKALDLFPKSAALRYDLACYACLLGKLDEARALLEQVFECEDPERARAIALEDKDLKALWDEIREM